MASCQTNSYVTDGPWGTKALNMEGTNRWLNLPEMMFGAQLSFCAFLRTKAYRSHSYFIQIGNAGGAFTANPTWGDIIWLKMMQQSKDLELLTMRGNMWKPLVVTNGW